MATTAGIAFFAASAYDATLAVTTGVVVSCVTMTLPGWTAAGRGSRSGRNVGDDEQCGYAERAGLREEEPDFAEHGESIVCCVNGGGHGP